jgi:hypothetical protein
LIVIVNEVKQSRVLYGVCVKCVIWIAAPPSAARDDVDEFGEEENG